MASLAFCSNGGSRLIRIDSLVETYIHVPRSDCGFIFIFIYLVVPASPFLPASVDQQPLSLTSFIIQQLLLICPVYGSIKIDWKNIN